MQLELLYPRRTRFAPPENEILRIGQQTSEFRVRLTAFSRQFSDDLKAELTDLSRIIRRYRYVNLMMFFGIAGFVGIAVWFVISRSVTRPLNRIIENLSGYSAEIVSEAARDRLPAVLSRNGLRSRQRLWKKYLLLSRRCPP